MKLIVPEVRREKLIMEEDRISSSSDEFDFIAVNDELALIPDVFYSETDEDSDTVAYVTEPKIRIIESEGNVESEPVKDANSSLWVLCEDYNEVRPDVQFVPGQNPKSISHLQEPIDFFKLFFSDDLVNSIISESNKCAQSKLEGKTPSSTSIWRNWHDITVEEFWAFLAIIINMGTMPLDNMQEYWSKNVVSHIPFYSETFTRDRFSQIFWMLHFESNSTRTTNPRTRLQRVSCLFDYLNAKFLDYFSPGEQICVEESTTKLSGGIPPITQKKSPKLDVKVYTLSDSKTGYICCVLPYYESLSTELLVRPDLSLASRIPIHLYQMLLEKLPGAQGHHMYTDRKYTSYALAQELTKLKCSLTGIISVNRKELPEGLKKPKNSTVAYRLGNTLLLGWRDKKVVACLTTNGDTGMTAVKKISRGGVDIMVKKPNMALNYLKYRSVVHQYSSTYCFLRKSLKWWRKLFFWGLEITLLNSYILYKQEKIKREEKPLNQLRYVKTLVEQLRGSYRRQREQVSTSHSDEVRLNGKLHVIQKGAKRDCKVCSNRNTPGGRREISYYCDTCPDKPRMHIGDCFTIYHTKANYRK